MNKNLTISLTGWSKGIGKELDLSLSKQHNIYKVKNRLEDVDKIIQEIRLSDIFINNAAIEFKQVELFIKLFNEWKYDEDKMIINIGSRAGEPNLCKDLLYGSSKSALWHAHSNALYNTDKKCRLSYISLGLVNSEIESLDYAEVVENTMYILSRPKHIEITAMHIQHREAYINTQAKKEQYIRNGKVYKKS